jgi:hypothetical protein
MTAMGRHRKRKAEPVSVVARSAIVRRKRFDCISDWSCCPHDPPTHAGERFACRPPFARRLRRDRVRLDVWIGVFDTDQAPGLSGEWLSTVP